MISLVESIGDGPVVALVPAYVALETTMHPPPGPGVWLHLKYQAPYRRAFLSGWVPVRAAAPETFEHVESEGCIYGWAVDGARCTAAQGCALAAVLAELGLATFGRALAAFNHGRPVVIGPGFIDEIRGGENGGAPCS